MELHQLPTDILIHIFDFLTFDDLINMSKCNIFFYNFVKDSGNTVLVSNQFSASIRNRATNLLPGYRKRFVSSNWQHGKYKEKSVIFIKKRCMPCINLSKNYLLISTGDNIEVYKRTKTANYINKMNSFSFTTDVVKFSYKPTISKNYVVSGYRQGHICIWNLNSNEFSTISHEDESDINAVDIGNKDLFASGSKKGTINFFSLFKHHQVLHSFNIADHIWSMSFSHGGQNLAIGTAKYNDLPPLNVIDTEKCLVSQKLGGEFRKGSGILDVHWFNSNTLLTGGYDTILRKWDLRTGKCVQKWNDPYNSTIYCLDSDNVCTILTGTQNHGRVNLWDLRQTKCVQVYFVECCKKFSSPVYSLAFDGCQLYVSTDKNLSVLDFSASNVTSRDFRKCIF